jgi:hypothetical protein
MEQAHQPATNNHINRYERLGTCRSMISGIGIKWPKLLRDWGPAVSRTHQQLKLKVHLENQFGCLTLACKQRCPGALCAAPCCSVPCCSVLLGSAGLGSVPTNLKLSARDRWPLLTHQNAKAQPFVKLQSCGRFKGIFEVCFKAYPASGNRSHRSLGPVVLLIGLTVLLRTS